MYLLEYPIHKTLAEGFSEYTTLVISTPSSRGQYPIHTRKTAE
jgi:hypothetical protein